MTNDWHELTDLTGDRSFLVTEVRLSTGIALRGEFELPPLARLRYEDQVFVSEFVRSHGSIKDMEKAFGISYPTVKNRLNRIIDQLQLVEVDTAPARDDTFDLLERGEITADEAHTGAGAGAGPAGTAFTGGPGPLVAALPKYLHVQVNGSTGDNVHLKIPLALVRSGLKLTSLIPAQAMDQINKSMSEHGMSIDFSNLKPEDIDELIESLREMEINVDGKNGDVVRVYCA